MINVSDSEAADVGRMLQTKSWAIVMKHLLELAAIDRKNILGGQITQERMLELRAAQAGLQRIKTVVTDVYAAGKMKLPTPFESMLG
jgi:hypothetical protein